VYTVKGIKVGFMWLLVGVDCRMGSELLVGMNPSLDTGSL